MHIYRFFLWFTFVAYVGLGCKSSDSTLPIEEDKKKEIIASEFAEKIKEKTDLISSIERNITTEVVPGLSYTELNCLDIEGNPMAMFFITVDLGKGLSLAASAASDGKNLNAKESVRKQVSYVENKGHKVLAAVNGDFWRVNENENDNTPLGQVYGPIYIGGQMVKDFTSGSAYYFSGILNDGSFVMADKGQYLRMKDKIKEAIGGRYLLVDRGKNVSNRVSNRNIAPRTSIGHYETGEVVFVIIDGRRPNYSQGVTMQDLGKIFEAIEVEAAVNLDGGGSTTLFVKEKDVLTLKNKPSDNVERSVANAWTIIKK